MRKKYRWKKIEVWYGQHTFIWKETLLVDAGGYIFWYRMIERETLDKNLPTFNSDEWRREIAEWLTEQIS